MLGLNSPRSGRAFGTINDAFSESAIYWGDSGDWFVVAAVTGQSDALDRSNLRVLKDRLGDAAKVENARHWACGFVDYLIIPPNDRKAIRVALEAHKAARDYLVLDESDFSDLESEEFYELAKGELQGFDNWEAILWEEGQKASDYNSWDTIEAARERLEHPELEPAPPEPIDPNQLHLFN